jgi:uncharacterized protein (TIGR04255 family)
MADRPGFDPLFPAHAIERCAATLTYRESLPQKPFERAISRSAEAFAKKGLQRTELAGFSINVLTGAVGPAVGSQPRSFALPDGSANLIIAPNLISWQNTRYVRWAPFAGQFQDLALPAISEFLESVSISSVRLEYWDRFNWSGTWDDFDAAKLIRSSAISVARGWPQWGRQWHSHAGWFEPIENFRRLHNVNVDIGEVLPGRPSVLIYSTIQDESNVPGYGEVDQSSLDERFIFSRLDRIHRDLKALLATVINDDMIQRINLNAEVGA